MLKIVSFSFMSRHLPFSHCPYLIVLIFSPNDKSNQYKMIDYLNYYLKLNYSQKNLYDLLVCLCLGSASPATAESGVVS